MFMIIYVHIYIDVIAVRLLVIIAQRRFVLRFSFFLIVVEVESVHVARKLQTQYWTNWSMYSYMQYFSERNPLLHTDLSLICRVNVQLV